MNVELKKIRTSFFLNEGVLSNLPFKMSLIELNFNAIFNIHADDDNKNKLFKSNKFIKKDSEKKVYGNFIIIKLLFIQITMAI